MKNILFLFIFFLQSLNISAQTQDTIRSSLSIIEFEKLKSDFSKISKTKLYKKSEKASEDYLRNAFICSNKETEEKFKKCLTENVGDKKAKKIIALGKNSSQLNKKLEKRFPETFVLFKKATIEQRSELHKMYSKF